MEDLFAIFVPFFQEKFMASHIVNKVTDISLFTIQPLHNLHLEISKLVKDCTVKYLYPEQLRAGGAR